METYDRAEIVEDRKSDKLHVYFFIGDKRVSGPVSDLRWDYADADIEEIRTEITAKHGISRAQIFKRVEAATGSQPTRPKGRGKGSSKRRYRR
jgi:hypothetical protein